MATLRNLFLQNPLGEAVLLQQGEGYQRCGTATCRYNKFGVAKLSCAIAKPRPCRSCIRSTRVYRRSHFYMARNVDLSMLRGLSMRRIHCWDAGCTHGRTARYFVRRWKNRKPQYAQAFPSKNVCKRPSMLVFHPKKQILIISPPSPVPKSLIALYDFCLLNNHRRKTKNRTATRLACGHGHTSDFLCASHAGTRSIV